MREGQAVFEDFYGMLFLARKANGVYNGGEKKESAGEIIMLAQERQEQIMRHLSKNRIIKITDAVKMFHVSHETVRRDLEALQEQKLIKRVYGGAVLADGKQSEHGGTGTVSRSVTPTGLGYRERAAIGRAAAELVDEGDSVLLAIGSTILEVARNLKEKQRITVLTNSLPVLNELVDSELEVYVLGGKVCSDEQSIGGQLAYNALQSFFVDRVFVGAGGVTFEGGVSDYSEDESHLIATMMSRAKEVVLVAHSEKFGINSFSVTCPLEDIDIIVSDTNLSEEYRRGIEELGIRLVLSELWEENEEDRP